MPETTLVSYGEHKVASVFQKWIDDPNTKLPITLAECLTPVLPELGELTVVHPTPKDPVLVSSTCGAIAIWFNF